MSKGQREMSHHSYNTKHCRGETIEEFTPSENSKEASQIDSIPSIDSCSSVVNFIDKQYKEKVLTSGVNQSACAVDVTGITTTTTKMADNESVSNRFMTAVNPDDLNEEFNASTHDDNDIDCIYENDGQLINDDRDDSDENMDTAVIDKIKENLFVHKSNGGRRALPTTPISKPPLESPEMSTLNRQEKKIAAVVTSLMSSWIIDRVTGMTSDLREEFADDIKERFEAVSQQVDEWDMCTYDMATTSRKLEELDNENEELKSRVRMLEGRLTRAEKEVCDLKEELLKQQARSMQDNLKFFNIPETYPENAESTLQNFLKTEMKIADNDMKKINFDRVHRTGERTQSRHRAIVAKFNPYEGKLIVLKHIKNLDKAKGYGINDQLPREYEERKKQLLPAYRAARKQNKPVKWAVDKLIVGGEIKQAKRDKVTNMNEDPTEKAMKLEPKSTHGPRQQHEGSSFQAHIMTVNKQEDIIPALHALYADKRVALAEHNTYAYRLKHGNEYLEHFQDDGEYGAGRMLLEVLKNSSEENVFLCVTRWCGERKLGKKRFDIIRRQAKEVIELRG